MSKPLYILGTSLSHDGSACLLKDGKICAAIEKERITRKKHDGWNDDTAAILYCLEKENISIGDIDMIVQNSPGNSYEGARIFQNNSPAPVITISHHLAHAYSAFGTSNFNECAVLVIDGFGNSLDNCMDIDGDAVILNKGIPLDQYRHYYESNSYYHFNGNQHITVGKEVSRENSTLTCKVTPVVNNSIGDLFHAVSRYCFRGFLDAGKLMGLAPYGDPFVYRDELIHLKDGMMFVDYSVLSQLNKPAKSDTDFKDGFQYYANIANWLQRELERSVLYIINSRFEMHPSENLAYAGGVALNAVVNGKILEKSPFKNLYIQPAAGDNGISIGCAFYGWMQISKKEKVIPESTTCYGKIYDIKAVKEAVHQFHSENPVVIKKKIDYFFNAIGKRSKDMRPTNYKYLLQFSVENAGIYQVSVSKEGIQSEFGIIGRPTSEVRLRNTDFYNGLADPGHFLDLLAAGKIQVTNYDELNHLLDAINFTFSMKKKGTKNSLTHTKYFHCEGEGYIEETARLLSKGKVIGWFQDESEFGPRALGRRSILADPRKRGVRDYINLEIKCREDFRPFAPSVLLEDLPVYFKTEMESPYMLIVGKVKEEWRKIMREVVHLDGSCRIQTVTPDWNPKYTTLLKEFKQVTGISILLNTSFNGRAMPIVETPADALRFFYDSKLDYLVLQDLIIRQSSR
jgi:predicted NodU family carbamoyl transferase